MTSRVAERLRKVVLTGSVLLLVAVPLWHIARLEGFRASAFVPLLAALGIDRVEPVVIGAPWTLAIFGLEIMDPLAATGLAAAGAVGLSLLIAAIPALLLVGLFGRFFCRWICPYAVIRSLSYTARRLLAKVGLRAPDHELPRGMGLMILVFTLTAAAVGGTQLAPLFYPPSIIGREVFRALFFGGVGTGALVIVVAFTIDTFVARDGFCGSVCPGGAIFGLIGRWSPFEGAKSKARCMQCGVCTSKCSRPDPSPLSRRGFFAAAGVGVVSGVVVQHRAEARLRPPGAREGREFLSRCIRCFRCAEVCPTRAIRFDALTDLGGAYTPTIDPNKSACVLCMRCTEVCPTGALERVSTDLVEVAKTVRIGAPALDRDKCLSWTGEGNCRLCWYACPYPDRAVTLEAGTLRPVFSADACVGCGLCAEACPENVKAIQIVPQRADARAVLADRLREARS